MLQRGGALLAGHGAAAHRGAGAQVEPVLGQRFQVVQGPLGDVGVADVDGLQGADLSVVDWIRKSKTKAKGRVEEVSEGDTQRPPSLHIFPSDSATRQHTGRACLARCLQPPAETEALSQALCFDILSGKVEQAKPSAGEDGWTDGRTGSPGIHRQGSVYFLEGLPAAQSDNIRPLHTGSASHRVTTVAFVSTTQDSGAKIK